MHKQAYSILKLSLLVMHDLQLFHMGQHAGTYFVDMHKSTIRRLFLKTYVFVRHI